MCYYKPCLKNKLNLTKIQMISKFFKVIASWCAHFTLMLCGWKPMHFFSVCDLQSFLHSKEDPTSKIKPNQTLLIICKKTSSWDDFFLKLYLYEQAFSNFCIFDEKMMLEPSFIHQFSKTRIFIFASYKTFLWESAANIIHPTYIVGGGVNYHPKIKTFHLGDPMRKWINTQQLDRHESRTRLKRMLATVYPLYDESNEGNEFIDQYSRLLSPRKERIFLVSEDINVSYSQVKDVRAIDLITLSLFSFIVPILAFKMIRSYDMCLVTFWLFYKLFEYHSSYENERNKSPRVVYPLLYLIFKMLYVSFTPMIFAILYAFALLILGGKREMYEYRTSNYVLCRSLFYSLMSSLLFVHSW